MHVTRKHPALRYDGTNAAEVLNALGGYELVSEADGVLTVLSLIGGGPLAITAEWVIVDGWPYSPEQLAQQFYVVPEA
ncbi:hypothetical protein GA0074692_6784 [Micromonospora pallida]|uniref:Uncharacterized protein n=1 Tax=Micromonospora pallida TaxID=145854 RepID=A0A1C6TN08_9ACTN|nr:hypothetical protein [Micromonospora pallida]SCL43146.1 hypothetical protein GA0074692_6733 [Micromonospora pallida]SCL43244.1 hypothetical protein GA0074692_6784 [Micromonospora pallida]